ncbi:electron transfer flavoprotein subunit beta/FixA family protein, partial [Chloroflexota bacterium]
REAHGGQVTVVSVGQSFALDVIKRPLSMGADKLILLQDEAFENTADSHFTVTVLTEAIKKIGEYDIIIAGRQASDWDNARVPLGIAEMLGIPIITIGRKVEVNDGNVIVERVLPDGYEVMEAPLPAIVTVSNELGIPRYPSLSNVMAASRKLPTTWSASDIGIDPSTIKPRLKVRDLFIPISSKRVEWIEGEDAAEKAMNLTHKLHELKLI